MPVAKLLDLGAATVLGSSATIWCPASTFGKPTCMLVIREDPERGRVEATLLEVAQGMLDKPSADAATPTLRVDVHLVDLADVGPDVVVTRGTRDGEAYDLIIDQRDPWLPVGRLQRELVAPEVLTEAVGHAGEVLAGHEVLVRFLPASGMNASDPGSIFDTGAAQSDGTLASHCQDSHTSYLFTSSQGAVGTNRATGWPPEGHLSRARRMDVVAQCAFGHLEAYDGIVPDVPTGLSPIMLHDRP